MSNKSKRTGSEWEIRLTNYLRGFFPMVERLRQAGVNDEGDVWFAQEPHRFVVEAKAERTINLSAYVTEAKVEAANYAKARRWPIELVHPVAIIKRRNHHVSKAYVVMELDEFVRLVKGM